MRNLWNWSHNFWTCGIGHNFFSGICGIGHNFWDQFHNLYESFGFGHKQKKHCGIGHNWGKNEVN